MAELLLELLSEEIPAGMQKQSTQDLKRLFLSALAESRLECVTLESYVSPRRLVLFADGLPNQQEDFVEDRKGPSVNAPSKAIKGFLRANGLSNINEAEVRNTNKGDFYFHVLRHEGLPVRDILGGIISSVLSTFPWPKSMRWADYNERWVRPLESILFIFDGSVVPLSFAGVNSSNKTKGHRFHSSEEIIITDFADYLNKLEQAKVMVDGSRRKDKITNAVNVLAEKENLTFQEDLGLLQELSGLVEWPVPLIGTIDKEFIDLPHEVLHSAMRKHQKYLALYEPDGSLANRFAIISNIETENNGHSVVEGNERVLRARLSDAKFFWDNDLIATLESKLEKLSERIFYNELGTMLDKTERVEKLCNILASNLSGVNKKDLARAARLSKADLCTGLVGEFPDLQGIMGCYYASNDGESQPVCLAISQHYSPQGPSDEVPVLPESICLALADKIDTLVGFFGISKRPSGSKDPFALRRTALGIIRIILENNLRFFLKDLFSYSYDTYGLAMKLQKDDLVEHLLVFFHERFKVYLKDNGFSTSLIISVLSLSNSDDLVELRERINAIKLFLSSDDGNNLLSAYKRAANIVRIEHKKDQKDYISIFEENNLDAPQAISLFRSLEQVEEQVKKNLDNEKFDLAMLSLASLRQPVDLFFEKVTVNSENKAERLANLGLLSQIGRLMNKVADFSAI